MNDRRLPYCPRCGGASRVWGSGQLICGQCGERFVPDDSAPADEPILSWHGGYDGPLPKDHMRELLDRAMAAAKRQPAPGDWGLTDVRGVDDVEIGGGMYMPDGWTLQVVLLNDERMFRGGPHVVVDAYRGSTFTLGRLRQRVVYSADDLAAIRAESLTVLRARRQELDERIAKIEAEGTT